MSEFDAQGIRVVALSYDEPGALRDFADAYQITYELLSDPDSAVIRQYGILNTLIAEDDHPWFGIPFPGTYVADSAGAITHKFFENNLVLRVGPEELLRAVRGENVDLAAAGNASAQAATVAEPQVFLDAEYLAVGVLQHLVCQFPVPPGRHLYAAPAPNGMVPFSVAVNDHPKLVVRAPKLPASETHQLAGTDEEFPVHHGQVEIRIPVTANGVPMEKSGNHELEISGEVRWQLCDARVCDVPQRQPFSLRVPVQGSVVSEMMTRADDSSVRPMNAKQHFQTMTTRRQSQD